jgi:hypothetical protein
MPSIYLSCVVASATNTGLAFIPRSDIGINCFLRLVCPIAERLQCFELLLDDLQAGYICDSFGLFAPLA